MIYIYDKDENGEQAKVVRRIYEEYLSGKGIRAIGNGLEKDRILTCVGKLKWYDSTIQKILRNEKYTGDALLQKTITVDFLTHKRVKNKGEVQQYYVEDSHPAIISKKTFQRVQEEIKRRANLVGYSEETKSRYTNKYVFSGKIICGNCGSKFRRKRWGPGEKYKKHVWLCANHIDNGVKACDMKAVDEEKLKLAFVKSLNKIIENKDTFISKIGENINKGIDKTKENTKLEKIKEELEKLNEQMINLVRLNVKSSIDDEIYIEEYKRLEKQIKQLKTEKIKINKKENIKEENIRRIKEIEEFLKEKQSLIGEFDEELFKELVDKIKVISFVKVEFAYKIGVVIKEIL